MSNIRPPAVAGMFYPANNVQLHKEVVTFLQLAKPQTISRPKALICPHAGYRYSGMMAANCYKTLEPIASSIQRVVLVGPAHRYGFYGIAIPSNTHFATPMGMLPLDQVSLSSIAKLPQVKTLDKAFDGEHCLEVQLPFIQHILPHCSIVPCLAGNVDSRYVAELLIDIWGGEETLIIISSDLSHYYNYEQAKALDEQATSAIINLKPDLIKDNHACGRIPIKGLLLAASQQGLRASVLGMCNSGDTYGDKSRVVGYGAYHFAEGG